MKINHTNHEAVEDLERPKFEGEVRAFSAFLWWPKRIGHETRWLETAYWIKTAKTNPGGPISTPFAGTINFAPFLYWEESWSSHPYDTQIATKKRQHKHGGQRDA